MAWKSIPAVQGVLVLLLLVLQWSAQISSCHLLCVIVTTRGHSYINFSLPPYVKKRESHKILVNYRMWYYSIIFLYWWYSTCHPHEHFSICCCRGSWSAEAGKGNAVHTLIGNWKLNCGRCSFFFRFFIKLEKQFDLHSTRFITSREYGPHI